jgi:hypothetical protein
LLSLLAAWLVVTSARADDAAIKKQLLGYWKGPDNQTIIVKADGTMTSSGYPVIQKWNVRNGVFHTVDLKEGTNKDSFKIISLTKAKFVIQDMYHGRHTGTWTRITAPKANR